MKKVDKQIHQIDASGKVLGRLASEIAILLRGKNKPTFRPNLDEGDQVEVFHCSQLKFTGKKLANKQYRWHSNYPGGLKSKKMQVVFEKNPAEVLKRAVWGMLPKNRLRPAMIKRLKIFAGIKNDNNHQ